MKFKTKMLAILFSIAMLFCICVPAFAAERNSRGSSYGQQSGYYINKFDVNLSSGGDNGSAVFRLYTTNASDSVSVKVYYNGNVVAQKTLTANDGEEQTVYFKSGAKAQAGTYTISYQCYTSALNPIQCWICSW